MVYSIFLAKLIGPAALLIGLVVLADPARVRTMAREALEGEMFIFLAGLLSLVAGLALVNTHNVWTGDWRVLITLVGWLAVFGGIARVGFGRQLKPLGRSMSDNRMVLGVAGGSFALIGALLTYSGYVA